MWRWRERSIRSERMLAVSRAKSLSQQSQSHYFPVAAHLQLTQGLRDGVTNTGNQNCSGAGLTQLAEQLETGDLWNGLIVPQEIMETLPACPWARAALTCTKGENRQERKHEHLKAEGKVSRKKHSKTKEKSQSYYKKSFTYWLIVKWRQSPVNENWKKGFCLELVLL